MKKKVFAVLAAVLLAVVFMPAAALADLTYASSPIGDQSWYSGGADATYGTSFTNSNAFTVAKLGFFDVGGDGLAYSHDVGIWNAAGTLLGKVTIAAGTTAPIADGFRWANLASSVLLSAGNTYIIGATMAKDNSSDLMGNSAKINSPFTLVSDLYHDNVNLETGLQKPDTTWQSPPTGWYGPNIATPIPAAVWLLGSGLVGLVAIRRRMKK